MTGCACRPKRAAHPVTEACPQPARCAHSTARSGVRTSGPERGLRRVAAGGTAEPAGAVTRKPKDNAVAVLGRGTSGSYLHVPIVYASGVAGGQPVSTSRRRRRRWSHFLEPPLCRSTSRANRGRSSGHAPTRGFALTGGIIFCGSGDAADRMVARLFDRPAPPGMEQKRASRTPTDQPSAVSRRTTCDWLEA